MSDRPQFNVAQLMKDPIGATRTGQIAVGLRQLVSTEDRLDLMPDADDPVLAGPIRLMHTAGGVLATGQLHAEATMPCARCLEAVSISLDIEVEEIFVPTVDIVTGQSVRPEEEDRALWIDAHHVLDLTEVLRQDVLVALPMHVVCDADCRGLCPTCGKNLNEGPCDCEPEPDPRWAALLALQKNTPSGVEER